MFKFEKKVSKNSFGNKPRRLRHILFLEVKEPKQNNKGLIFIITTNFILIIGIYLYFIGWAYNYYFYSNLGIGYFTFSIPLYHIMTSSYNVITYLPTIIIIALFFTIIIILYFLLSQSVKNLILITLLVMLFPAFLYCAKQKASLVTSSIRAGNVLNPIQFVFKDNNKNHYSKYFMDANDKTELKLITKTNDRYYVLHQPIMKDVPELPFGIVYDIPFSEISHAKIMLFPIVK